MQHDIEWDGRCDLDDLGRMWTIREGFSFVLYMRNAHMAVNRFSFHIFHIVRYLHKSDIFLATF